MTPAQAARAARDNFCAATLEDLVDSCLDAAVQGGLEPLEALALHSLFFVLWNEVGHGPTSASRVDAMAVHWRPILDMLIEHSGDAPIPGLADAIAKRRHLIP